MANHESSEMEGVSEIRESEGKGETTVDRRFVFRELDALIQGWLPKAFEESWASEQGFTLDLSIPGIICPAGMPFTYGTTGVDTKGYYSIRFRNVDRPCLGCTMPNKCGGNRRQTRHGYKPGITISPEGAEAIRKYQESRSYVPKVKPPLVLQPTLDEVALFTASFPCFIPSEARRTVRSLMQKASIRVEYTGVSDADEESEVVHPMIAPTPRRRSHCRLSREEILGRYRLPEQATVVVTIRAEAGDHALLARAFCGIRDYTASTV